MMKTHSGSCHCGALKFEADIDVTRGTYKCNCTICVKMRLWSFEVAPENLRILAGQEFIQDYTYGAHVAHHWFCRRCGVRPFERVELAHKTYFNVSVVCLDGLDMNELMAAPVHYQDGLHNDWDRIPDETRHL